MVNASLTCPWHSLFLCMPSLRLFLATGHHSAHAQDRWKYCGVSAPWEHSSTNKWWDWWINTPAPSPLHAVTLKCLLYTASQRFPEELSPSCSSGNLFDLIISPLFPAIPVSFQHFPSSVFWDPLHLNPCLNVSFLENPTKVKENEKNKDSHYLNWLSLKARRTDSSEKGISCGTC